MHPKQRGAVPLEHQTGLPPGIYYQPKHVGGSLGFGAKAFLQPMWDQLEAEAAAAAEAAPVAPGGAATLRNFLNNFLFQATTVSQLVVPYNRARVYLMMQNLGASSVFVAFGREATLADSFQMVGGGGFYEPILGTTSSVHMIAAAGTQNVIIVEGFEAP